MIANDLVKALPAKKHAEIERHVRAGYLAGLSDGPRIKHPVARPDLGKIEEGTGKAVAPSPHEMLILVSVGCQKWGGSGHVGPRPHGSYPRGQSLAERLMTRSRFVVRLTTIELPY